MIGNNMVFSNSPRCGPLVGVVSGELVAGFSITNLRTEPQLSDVAARSTFDGVALSGDNPLRRLTGGGEGLGRRRRFGAGVRRWPHR